MKKDDGRWFPGAGTNWFWLATSAVAISTSARAVEPADLLAYRMGPISLRPQLGVSETYNDNIFYQASAGQDDLISTVSPGLTALLGRLDDNYFALNYRYDRLFYAQNPAENAGNHFFSLLSHWEGARLAQDGTDTYSLESSILSGFSPDVGVLLTGSRNVNIDRSSARLDHRISYELSSKTGIYVDGAFNRYDFRPPVQLTLYDHNTWQGTGGFKYTFSPKTSFFGEVFYGQTTSSPNFNAPKPPVESSIGGYVGAKGEFTSHLSGQVKVGYESAQYAGNGGGVEAPVLGVSLTDQFNYKTALTLGYDRGNRVAVWSGVALYTFDRVSLAFNRMLGESGKLLATAGGSFENDDYSDLHRDYRYYTANAALAYSFKVWLTAQLGYQYERLDGGSSGAIDYQVNQVTLGVSVGY